MLVQNLSNTPFSEIVDCFIASFEGYFFKVPTDYSYYKERWGAANVNYSLSYGMFEENKLIGFIIHAIEKRNGVLIAYNTGTGVLPEYRGKKILKNVYEFAIEDLLKNDIEKSVLEVITDNIAAVNAYQKAGFSICREYKCFESESKIKHNKNYELQGVCLSEVDWEGLPNQEFYAWDFQKQTIARRGDMFYNVDKDAKKVGYFIYSYKNNYLSQFDVFQDTTENWDILFDAMANITDSARVINVDIRLQSKIKALERSGFRHTLTLYEMEMSVKG